MSITISAQDVKSLRERTGSRSIVPDSVQSRRSCRRRMRLLMVWKLVRSPPSQRWSM